MPSFIVFTLAGPLASFGTVAGNERRGTEMRPGHSMLSGLMAAALGIRRDQPNELAAISDACKFAVRIDQLGHLMTDYHTVQSAKRRKGFAPQTRRQMLAEGDRTTIVTRREYLSDVRYTVAISFHHPQVTPAKLIEHLKRPHFTLYLGRKSCPPALPLDPILVDDTPTIDLAFGHYDKTANSHAMSLLEAGLRSFARANESGEISADARLDLGARSHRSERRRVRPVDRVTWRFHPLEELVLAAPPEQSSGKMTENDGEET